MNKIIIIIIVLIVLVLQVQAAIKPNVIATGYRILNGTASVGKSFILSVKLENTETDTCAQNIVTTIKAGYPFIMYGISSKSAGSLCSGSMVNVDFPVKIDPTSTGGFYQLTVTNNFETTTLAQFSSSSTLNVFIQGSPDINTYIINSNPADVYPGDTAQITVMIENDGTFLAQSLTAVLHAETPLKVKWANSIAALGAIDSRQSKTADFLVEVPKDASSHDYHVNIIVDYLDENLEEKTKSTDLIFHVARKAKFEAYGNNAFYPNQDSRSADFIFNNTGTNTAKKLVITLIPQYPFSTDGSSRYIDVLNPGESNPIELIVNTDKNAKPGVYGLKLLVDFEHPEGKDFQDTTDIPLTIKSNGFFRVVFLNYWFLWVLAAAGAFLAVRRYKKKGGIKK
jgi:hypothetical protein